jgi:hypothetical protein
VLLVLLVVARPVLLLDSLLLLLLLLLVVVLVARPALLLGDLRAAWLLLRVRRVQLLQLRFSAALRPDLKLLLSLCHPLLLQRDSWPWGAAFGYSPISLAL